MITGQLRSQIDKLWEEFWTGGITNPLTVIEQISFLMFLRLLDIQETANEKRAARSKKPLKDRFIFKKSEQKLRWKNLRQQEPGEMLRLMRDEVFPFLRQRTAGTTFGDYMKDAQFMIQKPSLLVSAVNRVEKLPLTQGDVKGDLYEYLLGKLTTAGINGQFRTPRHVIDLMVALVDPQPTELVADPACGTAGFLARVNAHLFRTKTSKKAIYKDEDGNEHYPGDLLSLEERKHIQGDMFHGFDFDSTMLRIAAMNLMLHGVENPDIHYQDTLSSSFSERFPDSTENALDVVLANPPFKGSLDHEDVHPGLMQVVKTKKTELLFIALILRMLRMGGRSATVVPDGVLFGTSKAHQALRTALIDENQLEGVIKLPSGVFKPYAGVSTAILVFTKGGKTDQVFFYNVEADGYSLDDKRDPIQQNDLPDAATRWKRWKKRNTKKAPPSEFGDRTSKCFFVPADEIRAQKYDISFNRYKEVVHEEVEYERPKDIIKKLRALEKDIAKDLDELERMLG